MKSGPIPIICCATIRRSGARSDWIDLRCAHYVLVIGDFRKTPFLFLVQVPKGAPIPDATVVRCAQ